MRRVFLCRNVVLLAWLLLCLTSAAIGQTVDPAKLAEFRGHMQSYVDRQEFAGIVAVIGRRDGIVAHEAIGFLDLAHRQSMPKDALFRIASMTKPVTAIGIMILVDEGKLSVTDPVERHLPEFRGQKLVVERTDETTLLRRPRRPITIRDLLTHTSGLPDRTQLQAEIFLRRNRWLAEAVMAYSQMPLEFEPGTSWAYCNMGIDVLGRLIEVVSGQSYEDFLAERVFQPLAMMDTTFYPTADQLRHAAEPGMKRDGKLVPPLRSLFDPSPGARYPMPCGGLFTTAADLSRLYRMMLGRGALDGVRILTEASVAAMASPQTEGVRPGAIDTGFGWAVIRGFQRDNSHLSIGSFGHSGALHTNAWIDPHKDLFTIVLLQRQGLPNADGEAIKTELQGVAISVHQSN
jgi:CubicO group peptidase (beta-lactamase class C family)